MHRQVLMSTHLRRALGSRASCAVVRATASKLDFGAAVLGSDVLQQRMVTASSSNVFQQQVGGPEV